MIIDSQLKSLLRNYLKTILVGFGDADVLGFSVRIEFKEPYWLRLSDNDEKRGIEHKL